jgi:hypothetical protein
MLMGRPLVLHAGVPASFITASDLGLGVLGGLWAFLIAVLPKIAGVSGDRRDNAPLSWSDWGIGAVAALFIFGAALREVGFLNERFDRLPGLVPLGIGLALVAAGAFGKHQNWQYEHGSPADPAVGRLILIFFGLLFIGLGVAILAGVPTVNIA